MQNSEHNGIGNSNPLVGYRASVTHAGSHNVNSCFGICCISCLPSVVAAAPRTGSFLGQLVRHPTDALGHYQGGTSHTSTAPRQVWRSGAGWAQHGHLSRSHGDPDGLSHEGGVPQSESITIALSRSHIMLFDIRTEIMSLGRLLCRPQTVPAWQLSSGSRLQFAR